MTNWKISFIHFKNLQQQQLLNRCRIWLRFDRPEHCDQIWPNFATSESLAIFLQRFTRRYSLNLLTVWPDWVIFWTLGNFLKPLATINLPKSPTFIGNFCKGFKIYFFASEIILDNFYWHLAIFFWSHCLLPLKCPQLGWSSILHLRV